MTKIEWNCPYWFVRYGVYKVFESLPAVTLESKGQRSKVKKFDFLTPKSNQHIYEPKYICDQNWVKIRSLYFDILYSPGFSGHCLLWPWPLSFRLQNLINTSANRSTPAVNIGWNFLNWFLRYGIHKVFGTHRLTHSLTHSLTDGHSRMQYASCTVFQRWRTHKNKYKCKKLQFS